METTTSRGAERREAILRAATDLFLKHGFEGTSLGMVIEGSGGSRRTIYERFGNKEGLFEAVVDGMLDDLLSRFTSFDWETGGPEDVLNRAGSALVDALVAPRAIALLRMVIGEVGRFPDLGVAMFERGPERAYARLAIYLGEQEEAGTMQLGDPDLAARQLLEMMKGDMQLRALLCPGHLPKRRDRQRHVASAVRTFLAAVSPR